MLAMPVGQPRSIHLTGRYREHARSYKGGDYPVAELCNKWQHPDNTFA